VKELTIKLLDQNNFVEWHIPKKSLLDTVLNAFERISHLIAWPDDVLCKIFKKYCSFSYFPI